MTQPATSTAVVPLERAARHGKQLVGHLSRRHGGSWSEDDQSGWMDLQEGRATVTATAGELTLVVQGALEHLAQLEGVVGDHLVRFAPDQELSVRWLRTDPVEARSEG